MSEQGRELIEQLVTLNKEKIDHLENLLDNTKRQKLAISSNSLNSLLDYTRQKQEIMDAIDEIDRSFYLVFIQLKQLTGVESMDQISVVEYPQISSLKETVHIIMDVLKKIEELDHENLKDVQEEIEKIKGHIREVKNQRKVSKGYGTFAGSQGIDLQGYYIDRRK